MVLLTFHYEIKLLSLVHTRGLCYSRWHLNKLFGYLTGVNAWKFSQWYNCSEITSENNIKTVGYLFHCVKDATNIPDANTFCNVWTIENNISLSSHCQIDATAKAMLLCRRSTTKFKEESMLAYKLTDINQQQWKKLMWH